MGLTTETLLALRQKAVTKPAHTVQWSAAQIVALVDEVLAGRARVEELTAELAEAREATAGLVMVRNARAERDGVKAKDLKTLTKATDGLLEAFALYEQQAEPRAPRGAEGE
jgi:hypothetical protein